MSSMSRLLKYVLVVSLALFAPPAWALDTWDGSSGVLTDLNQISGTMGVDAVYEISTAHGLEYVAQQVNSGTTYSGETIRLTDDLNMNGFSWNFSTPIGDRSLSYAFEGTFDGNGHTISNLWMGLPSGDGVGLFGFIDDAVITNLILTGVNVAGQVNVGGLVGYSSNSVISNCAVDGTVNGDNGVGGFVGCFSGTSVSNSTAKVSVTGTGSNVGGFVGQMIDGGMTNCAAFGSVSGTDMVGGFAGGVVNSISTLTNCAAGGDVFASGDGAGGFAGQVYNAEVSNCAAIADVEGGSAGGLVGYTWATGSTVMIRNSVASGTVSGPASTALGYGGFVGGDFGSWLNPSVMDSFATGRVIGSAAEVGGFLGNDGGFITISGSAFDAQGTARNSAVGVGTQTAAALTTADLTSGAAPSGLTGSWAYAAGCYPQVPALTSSVNALVRAISALGSVPVFFGSDTDTSAYVTSMLKFPKAVGSTPVTWSASPFVLDLHDIGDGYLYSGWTSPGSVTVTASAGGVSKNFILALTGTLALREVHFDLRYIGGTPPNPFVVMNGSTISEPASPTRAGYIFDGWFTDVARTTRWNFSTNPVTADMTLYAGWLAVPIGIKATVNGTVYILTSSSDGSEWSVTLPAGVSNRAVSLDISLPTGAALSPPLTGPLDFSGGPRVFTCIAADGTTSEFTVNVAAGTGAVNAVRSVGTGRFPLTLSPGQSFETEVNFETEDGSSPFPAPTISAGLDSESASLVSADVVSRDFVVITALSRRDPEENRRGAANSAIYGRAVITITATQTLPDGSTLRSQITKSLIVGDELMTRIALSDDVIDVFERANGELASSDVTILPGNTQPPMDAGDDWYLVRDLDNADIVIMAPEGDHLPDCFAPTGKDAASITIGLESPPTEGAKGLVPMTYIVTTRRNELEPIFGAEMTSAILAAPMAHLSEIFEELVIQKEIQQGARAGWFTRLVDGVLKPEEAVSMGILDIIGGESLTMALSYYVLDDSTLEAFVRDGYLIVPDGSNDGIIADPIWFNRWRDGYEPGGNSLSGRSGNGSGCNAGLGLGALLAAGAALVLRKSFSIRNRDSFGD